jgi:hypothetical protein
MPQVDPYFPLPIDTSTWDVSEGALNSSGRSTPTWGANGSDGPTESNLLNCPDIPFPSLPPPLQRLPSPATRRSPSPPLSADASSSPRSSSSESVDLAPTEITPHENRLLANSLLHPERDFEAVQQTTDACLRVLRYNMHAHSNHPAFVEYPWAQQREFVVDFAAQLFDVKKYRRVQTYTKGVLSSKPTFDEKQRMRKLLRTCYPHLWRDAFKQASKEASANAVKAGEESRSNFKVRTRALHLLAQALPADAFTSCYLPCVKDTQMFQGVSFAVAHVIERWAP